MTPQMETLGLPTTGLKMLAELVREQTGMSFDNGRAHLLAERTAPLVVERGFRSFLDFYYLLKYDEATAPPAWRQVMDALSVPETYFWREIDQMRAVVNRVVPEVARRNRGVVRIWSAPCATGEEPLTLAMMLDEAGWFDRAVIEIHASDGSQAAIAKARDGRYRGRSMRALPEALRERYFSAQGDAFVPRPDLSSRITSWSVVNLMRTDEVALLARCPIVFCRNAFIYFSPDAIAHVIRNFATMMPSPAFLCVGASESLLNVTSAFSLEEVDGAFVYVKRGADD